MLELIRLIQLFHLVAGAMSSGVVCCCMKVFHSFAVIYPNRFNGDRLL
jgi:hypothetical protein